MGESTIGIPVRDEPPQGGLRSLVRRVGQVDEIGVIGALIVLIVLLALLVPDTFLTAQNVINVSRQASYVGIMAVGMVFVIAMGDIDLSVGSIWMLSSVMMAIALRDGYSIWIAVAVCMLVATLCGFLNGALSVALGIPTIIVTLGTLSLYRGLGLVVTNATPVSGYDLETWFFEWIGGRDPDLRRLDQRLGHAHRRRPRLGPLQPHPLRPASAGHRQQPSGGALLRYPYLAHPDPRHDPDGVHRRYRRRRRARLQPQRQPDGRRRHGAGSHRRDDHRRHRAQRRLRARCWAPSSAR